MASRFAFPRFGQGSIEGEAAHTRLAVMIPALLAVMMLVVGYTAADLAGIRWSNLFRSYLKGSFGFTSLSVLLYVFVKFALLWKQRADDPIPKVYQDLKSKAAFLLLPFLIFPLFYVGFTTAKSCIPSLVGYSWDATWAAADRMLFGDDVWRISQALLGTSWVGVYDFVYSVVWGSTLALFMANVPLYGRPQFVGIVYTAMLTTWFVGGWFMAYAMSAAGPTFAYLVDPAVGKDFAPLREALDSFLPAESRTKLSQQLLSMAINWSFAMKAGGISAMPSMHLGAVSIYVLAARKTSWFVPAVGFWIAIFVLSGYFGWHYWVDGIVAFFVAYASWKFAEACFRQAAVEPPSATEIPSRI